MCNLYQHAVPNSEIANFLLPIPLPLTENFRTTNIPSGYCGADQDGPIIRWSSQHPALEIATLRWGFPKVSEKHKSYITNIRNLKSSWWKNVNREYLHDKAYRCLVPFTRFAEWDSSSRSNAWFETTTEHSFFAGIWRPWLGERLAHVEGKKRRQRVTQDFELFSFLTTEPNEIVAPIHPKAMPVILTTSEECGIWMNGGEEALSLQKPLPESQILLVEND